MNYYKTVCIYELESGSENIYKHNPIFSYTLLFDYSSLQYTSRHRALIQGIL